MGAWGGGLYDSDFARDLKGLVTGVLRAPLSDEEALAAPPGQPLDPEAPDQRPGFGWHGRGT